MRKTLTTEYEYNSPCRNTGVSCFFAPIVGVGENDNRLEVLQLQGGYLYDKGENDELVPFVGLPQTIYKYIITGKP